jgi:hypothetical protein
VPHWPLGQPCDHRHGVNVAAPSPSSRRLAGAGTAPDGMPPASVPSQRFRPWVRRSVGLGPAVWPPQGALVMQLSRPGAPAGGRACGRRWPAPPGGAARPRRRCSTGRGGGAGWSPSRWRRRWGGRHRRTPGPGCACRTPAGRGCGGGGSPAGGGPEGSPGARPPWTHSGSRTDDGRAGTRPPDEAEGESSVIITARACLVPLRPTGAGPKPTQPGASRSATSVLPGRADP